MGEATDFRFGRNINRVHPNKSPIKRLEKRERRVSRDCPNFSGTSLLSESCPLQGYCVLVCVYVSPATRVGRQLAEIGDEIHTRYSSQFRDLVNSLNLRDDASTDSAYEAFAGVARQ